jgi:DNA-binding MarR family transcriptional regulator
MRRPREDPPAPTVRTAAGGAETFDAPLVPNDVEDLQSSVNYLAMWAASGRLRRDLMAASRFPLPDDVPAFLVVNRLVYGGATRPTVLADALQTGRSNVSKIVRRLEDAGLTTRVVDPTDERAVLVTMTAAGRDAAERIAAAGLELARAELGTLSPAEVETLRVLLAKVAGGLVRRYPFDRV